MKIYSFFFYLVFINLKRKKRINKKINKYDFFSDFDHSLESTRGLENKYLDF